MLTELYNQGETATSLATASDIAKKLERNTAVNQGYEQAKVDILPKALEQGRLEGYDLGIQDGEKSGARLAYNALTQTKPQGLAASIGESWDNLR